MTRVLLVIGALMSASGLALMLLTTTDGPAPTEQPATATSTSVAPSSTTSTHVPTPTSTTTPASTSTLVTTSPKTTSKTSPHKETLDVPAAPQRAELIAAAKTFVGDLGATQRSPKQWWQSLEPQLTPQAADDMSGMDPSWVQPMTVQRGGWVVAADGERGQDGHEHGVQLATDVVVPTNIGDVTVTLRPNAQDSSYQVVQYRLAEES